MTMNNCSGWSSPETHCYASWVDNDSALYLQASTMTHMLIDSYSPMTAAEKLAEWLRVTAKQSCPPEVYGTLYGQLAMCALERVNFRELAEIWISDELEARRERL